MTIQFFKALSIVAIFFTLQAKAELQHLRWVDQNGVTGQLQILLPQVNQETGLNLTVNDFQEVERTHLANYTFVTYLQLFQGVPVKGAVLRTWESELTGRLVLLDAHIDKGQASGRRLALLKQQGRSASKFLSKNVLREEAALFSKRGSLFQNSKTQHIDQWTDKDLERVVRIPGKNGHHILTFSHITGKLKSKTFKPYPQTEVPALVYPIYEETEVNHILQTRVPAVLRNLNDYRREVKVDPYVALKSRKYLYSKLNPLKAATLEGQAQGYWSMQSLMQAISSISQNLPTVKNSYDNGGIFLEGKYATVSLHPDVSKLKDVHVPLYLSDKVMFNWLDVPGGEEPDYEITLNTPYRGLPLNDAQAALRRAARRLPNHDPATYVNDGFDEVQVYYAMDTLMVSLQGMGFTDPELSTRPFHAFLFNPDIESRDNAFYTEDTINFTTYSPSQPNMARDNSTIWHELGHGIMDRLMGTRLSLADTGGLSEGMADFVALLVVQDVTNGTTFDGLEDFRINNNTGFYLTNESHDDGEAYGGSMRDLLMAAYAKEGRVGLVKVTDLTMDAMRLSRNHPALTANVWFDNMLLADKLGRLGLRVPGEMRELVVSALQSRNFRFDQGTPAKMVVTENNAELTDSSIGTRYNPYIHHLKEGETVSHDIKVSLQGSENYRFQYPVTVKVGFKDWALQGAVKWQQEAEPMTFVLNSEADVLDFKVTALSGCDFVNRVDGSCQDYAFIQIFNAGGTKPVAKKRFYLRVYTDKP
ncbi:MAG: M36 family metallopeptidase [Bdellovibrionota bacterium]